MSKPFTEDDLASQLTQDITWRLREISDLKTATVTADKIARTALLRATLAICYAHWEGHVRFSAQRYLLHVALRKITFQDLHPQFLRNHFLPRLATTGHKGIKERGEIVDLILTSGGDRFSRVNGDLISTKSNLSFEVLADICQVCGVQISAFADWATFVDVILLNRRNAIAHGENAFVDITELDELTEGTVCLMRIFSNELQANAYLGNYRAA